MAAAVAIDALPISIRATHCSAKLVPPALVIPPSYSELVWDLGDRLHLMGQLLHR